MSVNSAAHQNTTCNKIIRKEWHEPWKLLERASENHAVFVLNTEINYSVDISPLIFDIWNSAKVRITVDGGTDRWLKWVNNGIIDPKSFKSPDLITGDMDSISDKTLQYFSTRPSECRIIYTQDQNQTDFTKALIELAKYMVTNSLQVEHILVLNDMSGRFDQVIANINSLYKAKDIVPGVEVYILSPISLIWLLEPHIEHHIFVPGILREERKTCALLPIGGKCTATTSGLKWNLNNHSLEFGKLVSSSNTYDLNAEIVKIQCDNSLIWTMEIDSYLTALAQLSNNILST